MLNQHEIQLHGALLNYWDKFKRFSKPYVDEAGTQFHSFAANEAVITHQNASYFRLHKLGTTIIEMLEEKGLEIPSEQSLNRLIQFFDDTARCNFSFNIMELPILCRNIEGMNASIVDMPMIYMFMSKKNKFVNAKDYIVLPILSTCIESLTSETKEIDTDQLREDAKKLIDELGDGNFDFSFRVKEALYKTWLMLLLSFKYTALFIEENKKAVITTLGVPFSRLLLKWLAEKDSPIQSAIFREFIVLILFFSVLFALTMRVRHHDLDPLKILHQALSFLLIDPYEKRIFNIDIFRDSKMFCIFYCLAVLVSMLATYEERKYAKNLREAFDGSSIIFRRGNMHQEAQEMNVDISFVDDDNIRIDHLDINGEIESFTVSLDEVSVDQERMMRKLNTIAFQRFAQPVYAADPEPDIRRPGNFVV